MTVLGTGELSEGVVDRSTIGLSTRAARKCGATPIARRQLCSFGGRLCRTLFGHCRPLIQDLSTAIQKSAPAANEKSALSIKVGLRFPSFSRSQIPDLALRGPLPPQADASTYIKYLTDGRRTSWPAAAGEAAASVSGIQGFSNVERNIP